MGTNAQGLKVKLLGGGRLELSRDGESRVEVWPSAYQMAERLRALGFKPEELQDCAGSYFYG